MCAHARVHTDTCTHPHARTRTHACTHRCDWSDDSLHKLVSSSLKRRSPTGALLACLCMRMCMCACMHVCVRAHTCMSACMPEFSAVCGWDDGYVGAWMCGLAMPYGSVPYGAVSDPTAVAYTLAYVRVSAHTSANHCLPVDGNACVWVICGSYSHQCSFAPHIRL